MPVADSFEFTVAALPSTRRVVIAWLIDIFLEATEFNVNKIKQARPLLMIFMYQLSCICIS